ncbi:hypothetical protein BG844_04785 [Couchioplanes caeruleus subsp. caeruleus]|uniref:Uncharacterized protein n=2 Tax=Couchioplanes caeruleus TaxID=56438 RepID=A0A1K0GSK8_9ACTN|nr:hypothetical protein BG844_04785 [Couchioplanes caeruleus subsp. caeruleus]
MLESAGVYPSTVTAADVRSIVEVFRRFAALPVDGVGRPEEDGDGVLAQFGTFDFRGRPEFSADLTRQLIDASDEDAPMWQLSCTLHWASSTDTELLRSGHLWSFGKTLDEFFTEAVALPGWAWALDRSHTPKDLKIALTEV